MRRAFRNTRQRPRNANASASVGRLWRRTRHELAPDERAELRSF